MKRILVLVSIVAVVVVCTQTTFLNDMFLLLLLGILPGTSTRIPSSVMLVGYPLIAMLSLIWLLRQPMLIGDKKPSKVAKHKTKNSKSIQPAATSLPRRRYARVVKTA